MLDHKHLIISANIENSPKDPEMIKEWMKELIETIQMEILIGPEAIYYKEEPFNVGVTAFAIIKTSHIVLHTFEDENGPTRFELDVYSCKNFNISDVFDKIKVFIPSKMCYKFLDRENELKTLDIGVIGN